MKKGFTTGSCAAAASKAAEFMLRHVGLNAQADKLAKAMEICNETEKKVVITGHSDGATCEEFAEYVLETLAKL